jgi:hypothetical protein
MTSDSPSFSGTCSSIRTSSVSIILSLMFKTVALYKDGLSDEQYDSTYGNLKDGVGLVCDIDYYSSGYTRSAAHDASGGAPAATDAVASAAGSALSVAATMSCPPAISLR